jgi:hypothetical protein
MFGENTGKPVDVIAVESFRLNGEHVERFTVIKGMEADLAMELAGAGKVRAATKEALKEAEAAQANAEKVAAAQTAATSSPAEAIAAAVTAALAAAGIGAKTRG